MAEPPHRRRAHTRTRDLERYAGLFAERTRVMRSSAMRDLMAVTARPEVISLAGGLPDTSTFPPESFAAQMTRIAQESAAEALQYGPTEGFEETVDCIVQVMGAEGMLPDPEDVIVTTGGQQAIDLVCKTLVDPGDVVICEAPDLPRRGAGLLQLPGRRRSRSSATTTGCGSRSWRRCWRGSTREGRRPKFVYSVPSFQNPAGVTMSLERRRRLVELARQRELLVVEDNPYGLLRFGGEPLPPLYQLDGGDFVIYIGTFSKILSPGIRLGWAVAPPPVMEKIVLGKQAADLCTSTLTQYFVREYFAEGRWREYVDEPGRDLPRAPRRDARGAARALPARRRPGPSPRAASSSGRRCPTTSTPATCWPRRCARTSPSSPARPPTSTGRGRSSMRLNFSGVGEDEIREGIRRIGKAIAEQVELYGTLTGEQELAEDSPGCPDAKPRTCRSLRQPDPAPVAI